ncbi:Saccharopine dehydrogenase-domain-containing protein [Talaromyces proteolyticus]|uniref:Saccharopine dehydrogenase-domain-containing protein n=1 Tax=Talaromyces proteolyticus TaxID=1131652 RepID=A0AAD4L0H8_9EURO|nr:Saccharopine dehydrogenase-domain-containing protein [Talaromyces proteolyticus]KAH8705272.1 Saccharopine dehydrogenase-domain-containing protein [Talaromyces proteolyticus]
MATREFDLVLLGPTGYTGKYTAEYIYKAFPTTLKWALAGRSASKIEAVVREVKNVNVDRPDPEIIPVQLNKSELDALAKRTRLIINCVGPYHLYSTPVVAACAENGTHYVDVTGETPWLRRVIPQYHETAKENGAIIVPSCGVESAPLDILTWYAADFTRAKLSADPTETVGCIYDIKSAGPSGGTASTILTTLETLSIPELLKSSDSKCLIASPLPPTRITPRKSLFELIFGVREVSELGALTTSPTGMADEAIVNRSSTLMPNHYGPRFSIRQYLRVRNVFVGVLFHYAFTIGISLLVLAPFRWVARKLWPAPGSGPTKQEVEDDITEYRLVMSTNQKGANGKPKTVLGSTSYRGGQYELTAVAVGCAARVILENEKKIKSISAGIVTPATLGQEYVEELEKGGFKIGAKILDE